MTLEASGSVVYHDALGFQVDDVLAAAAAAAAATAVVVFVVVAYGGCLDGTLLVVRVGVPGALPPQEGERAQGHGKAGDVATRIVLFDRLDRFGELVGVVQQQFGHGPAHDVFWIGADDVLPRLADIADLAVQTKVHNDVHAVLGGLLEVLAFVAHVLAHGALHVDAVHQAGSGLLFEGGDGRRGQGWRAGRVGHGDNGWAAYG